MMRAFVLVALLFAIAGATLAEEAAPAPRGADEGPSYTIFTKLGRGIGNIILAPFEIPVTAYNVGVDTDVFIGVTAGSVAGVAGGVERLGAGIMDVITFLLPPYDRPLVTYSVGKSPAAAAAVATFPRDF